MLSSGRHIMMIWVWSPGVTSHITSQSHQTWPGVITASLVTGHHHPPSRSHSLPRQVRELICHRDHCILTHLLADILLSSELVIPLSLITAIIASSVLAIVRYSLHTPRHPPGLPYLHHPISHNNGKCVSCRAASSTCPCVFSKCCPNCIFRLQLMVSNLVTIQLPHSKFTFRFVCLGATEC